MDASVVSRQRRDLSHLSRLARADLRAFLWEVEDRPVADVSYLLVKALPELVEPYMLASGELAATWYEDLRRSVGVRGTFYASAPTPSLPPGQVNAVSRWAVGPLVGDDGAGPDPESVLSRLAGSAHRMVFDAAREAIRTNAVRDPVLVGYQRMARPKCCAFCGMLASRGAEYDGSGNGKYHDDCYCVVMPVFAGTEIAALAATEKEKFKAMYDDAQRFKPSGAVDTKETLAAWRVANETS